MPLSRPRTRVEGFPWLTTLPSELLRAHLGETAERLNVNALARALERRFATIWHYWRGRQRWLADDWIKAMIVSGAVSEGADAYWLRLPKTPEMNRAYDRLHGLPYLRPERRHDDTHEAASAVELPIPIAWEEFLDEQDDDASEPGPN